jgi:hypothetical protein
METALKITVKTYENLLKSQKLLLKERRRSSESTWKYRNILEPIDHKMFMVDPQFIESSFCKLKKHYGHDTLLQKCKSMMSIKHYKKLVKLIDPPSDSEEYISESSDSDNKDYEYDD